MNVSFAQSPKLLNRRVFVPLMIAGLLLAAAVSISAISAENYYPVKGTFRYSVFVQPEWLNTTSNIQGATRGRGFIFWYGWSNEIVEEQLAAVNAPLLQVTSQSLAYNLSDEQAFMRGGFGFGWNTIWAFYRVTGVGGNFTGTERARPAYIGTWRAGANGTVYATLLDINVTIQQGIPDSIHYDNSPISTSQTVDLTRSNVAIDAPIDLYNPILVYLKQSAGYLTGVALLLILAQAVVLRHRNRNVAKDYESKIEKS